MGLKKIKERITALETETGLLKKLIERQNEKIADLINNEQEPEKITTNRILDEWLNGAKESK